VVIAACGWVIYGYYKEHRKNKSKSKKNKHQKGKRRRKRDRRGGEKADWRRPQWK